MLDHDVRRRVKPADHFQHRFGLPAVPGRHRCGAELDQRHRIGVLAPHPLDLIGKIDHAVATAPARGREGESLGGLRINQVHEARVLPGIARLAIRADLPPGPIVIAEFSALRHGQARLAQPVFAGLPPRHFTRRRRWRRRQAGGLP